MDSDELKFCQACAYNRDSLVDLYMQVKIRSTEEVSTKKNTSSALQIAKLTNSPRRQVEEKSKLLASRLDNSDFIEYIQSSIEVMMSMKVQSMI